MTKAGSRLLVTLPATSISAGELHGKMALAVAGRQLICQLHLSMLESSDKMARASSRLAVTLPPASISAGELL
jgi:hypothetical protein